ncbi:Cof-type HAD-IIB family hydrolase [Mesomycoplasma conjunctivae]|uniref:Cof-type HAD-IIB family hydrolase n=1 Tax=Mesomycoplasma conjunctivae TaxID=45361 RepID=UPI003DA2FA4D
MKKKKLVFSDIDGTLYCKDFKLDKETIDYIRKIQKDDVIVILNTGNSLASRIWKIAADLDLRYVITSNGGLFSDLKEDKHTIISGVFDYQSQQFLLDLAKKYDLQCNFWNSKNFFSFNPKAEYQNSYNYPLLDTNEVIFTDSVQENIIKMELFGEEKLDMIYQLIKDNPKLKAVRVKGVNIEISPPGGSKGVALAYVCKHFAIDVDKVMTVGDSENDIEMLEATPYSYAMANAKPLIKKIAKLHTSACNQQGVIMAIKDFLYRSKND